MEAAFKSTLAFCDVKDEFRIWSQVIKPQLPNLKENVEDICMHAFTEMLNNVIDHSKVATEVSLSCANNDNIVMSIEDNGLGIFHGLKEFFGLDSDTQSLIELIKGKLTSAPNEHTGEGIFFSSKMFDRFVIESGDMRVVFEQDRCVVEPIKSRDGTLVQMEISKDSHRTSNEVFDEFCKGDDFVFCRTVFQMSVTKIEGPLVSRSQAKRIAARFDQFDEVEINFRDIPKIGQGFADELFRVWSNSNPTTKILALNANEEVVKMIRHVIPSQYEQSLVAAKAIAGCKNSFHFAEDGKSYSGKVMDLTNHHLIQNLGLTALIHNKMTLDRIPQKDEMVNIKYEGGRGIVEPRSHGLESLSR